MKVSQISVYENRVPNVRKAKQNHQRRCIDGPTEPTTPKNVAFKSNWGKVIGGIAGTIAIAVAAPAVAMAGLAGIGTIAGLAVGNAIDEKIEENENKNN